MDMAAEPSGATPSRRAGSPPDAWRAEVRVVVWLQGDQDPTTAACLADRLTNAAALGQGEVIVDLSEVHSIDGTTAQVLAHHHALLVSQSRRLTLRAPSPSTQRLLDICGLTQLTAPVPVHPTTS